MNKEAAAAMSRPEHLFYSIRWTPLVIGFFVTAVLALSVHAVMLQVFHVSYPADPIKARAPQVINDVVMFWGTVWLARSLAVVAPAASAAARVGILLLLLCCLNETLRAWFMNAYCANSPRAWAYLAIGQLPRMVSYAAVAVLAVAANRYFPKGWPQAVGTVLLGLLLSVAVPPMSAWVDTAIVDRFADWAPTSGWCQLPYGWNVLIPAYLTFIVEPATACLFCMAYASRTLGPRPWTGALAFMLLILALKKQLLAAVFYAIYAPLPPMTALASMGQFTLEVAVLGLGMAMCWQYACRRDKRTSQ